MNLNTIGGIDVSFSQTNPNKACVCVSFLDYPSLKLKYCFVMYDTIDVEYKSGFLAQREGPIMVKIIKKLKKQSLLPDAIIVDSQGKFHPRLYGLACYVGNESKIPTIGVGKKWINFDDVDDERFKNVPGNIIGKSGLVYGNCLLSGNSSRPIYVSEGFGIDLKDAVEIVRKTCVYRIPDPIRHADHFSREWAENNDNVKDGFVTCVYIA